MPFSFLYYSAAPEAERAAPTRARATPCRTTLMRGVFRRSRQQAGASSGFSSGADAGDAVYESPPVAKSALAAGEMPSRFPLRVCKAASEPLRLQARFPDYRPISPPLEVERISAAGVEGISPA